MGTLDDEIARHLKEAALSGELRAAESYGKPMEEDAGWHATPETLRMPFKILKNSGFYPPEIAMFHQRADLIAAVRACADGAERRKLQRQLSELEQKIALRLEALRIRGTL